MTESLALVVFLALLVVALAWLLGLPRRADPTGSVASQHDEVDEETLEEAERELDDLDAMTSADEADEELPDWGPGAPKPRRE